MGKKTLIISLLLYFLSLVLFEMTDLDFQFQNLFYRDQKWFLHTVSPVTHFIFYKLTKYLCAALAIYALVHALIKRKNKKPFEEYRGHYIVFLSVLILSASIALIFKPLTNVQCPDDLLQYGGKIPFVRIYEKYPINPQSKDGKWKIGRCYPSGHASGGFALMSLFFLSLPKRKKTLGWYGISFGFILGTIMSAYQILRGVHFISHQIATFLFALILIASLNLIIPFKNKDHYESSSH